MRRPSIYSRSAHRSKLTAQVEGASRAAALRRMATQIGRMIDVADSIGSTSLADKLDEARLEAERQLAEQAEPEEP